VTGDHITAAAISVVIPTRNGATWLKTTLNSVWAQSLRPLEVIVVDDGSTDATAQLLEPLASERRIRLLTTAAGGTARARNAGLAAARGSVIALLDHDDLWPPDKLAWQAAMLAAQPEAVLVYGYMESFGLERPYRWPRSDAPHGLVATAFRRKNWIRSPGQTLVRASAIRAVGGFDPDVAGADDWDLYLKLADRGPFIYSDRLALRYRVHARNQSKRAWQLFRSACQVQHRHAGRWPAGSTADRVRWLQCRATLLHMLARDIAASSLARVSAA
jgi:glycosyltransferase involved in cell wall biosynthesis